MKNYVEKTTMPTAMVSNTSEALIEDNGHETVTVALQLSVVGTFTFVAILANVLVIVAYFGKWRRSPNLFLVTLAISDIFNGVVLGVEFITRADIMSGDLQCVYSSLRQSLVYFGTLTSCVLVLCITADRYMRIGMSKRARLTPGKCLLIILSIVMVSLLLAGPFTLVNMTTRQSLNDDCVADMMDVGNNNTASRVDNTAHQENIMVTPGIDSLLGSVQGNKHSKPVALKSEDSYQLIFHIVIALQTVSAFICVFIMNTKIIAIVVGNGHTMAKHSQPASVPRENRLVYDRSSYTPSDTDISDNFHSSVPMERTELREKLSTLIAHQAANLDRHIKKRLSHIPSSARNRRAPPRTIVLLLIAAVMFLFNFPPIFLHITDFVQPAINAFLVTKSSLLVDFLKHSYVLCLLGNPVLYTFFNRGFVKHLRKACCCCDKKLYSLPRHRKQESRVVQTGNGTQLNPQVWFPTYHEIQRQTSYKTTAV